MESDYYYKKLIPLIMCDSVRDVYLEQQKKILQNGVMTSVLDVGIGENN